MKEGKESVKRSMKNFDEQCHEGKELQQEERSECLVHGLEGNKMCSKERKEEDMLS